MPKKQLILAHRGYSGMAPENTQLAFETAYNFGFDGVELDVHLTKDKELVIIHDEDAYRTALVKQEIEFTTLDKLKENDYGAFFKIKVPKQTILTLEEFFDLYLDKFSTINVEIKTDEKDYEGIEELIHKLAQKYDQEKFLDTVVFSSFNFKSLEKMYELNPKYQLAFLYWKQREFKKIDPKKIKKICKFLNPWTVLYERYKDDYKQLKLPFILWTIRDKKKFEQFEKDKDVFAQISNYKF